MNYPFQKTFRLTLIATAVLSSGASFAAGFGLMEQSVDSSRNVYAGQQAKCTDASYEAANPAMEVCIKKPELAVGAFAIPVTAKVKSGTWTTFARGKSPLSGVQSHTFGFVPNLHFVMPLNSHWALGMGAYSTAGLETDFTNSMKQVISSPVGAPTKTSILTLTLNPSLAYAFSPHFSVGAGVDFAYGTADYDAYGDNADKPITNELSGWGVGINLGALYRFGQTAIGLSYRSEVDIHAKGTSKSFLRDPGSYSDSASASLPLPQSVSASASLPLPQSVALGVSHKVGRFDLLATLKFTKWSTLNVLTIDGGNPLLLNKPLSAYLNFQDSWFESIGADYHVNDRATIGFGVGHEGTVTQDGYRDLRLPGAERFTVGIGGSYIARNRFKLNASFQHIFSGDVKVDDSKRGDPTGSAQATVAVDANIYGLGLVYEF